jgi:hypothetical protein
VGGFSAWGGIVRYLMENKASERQFSWREIFTQVVISGFTRFLAGVYGYEQGYSEFMTMVFSGLGRHLQDVLWRKLFNFPEKESNSKR